MVFLSPVTPLPPLSPLHDGSFPDSWSAAHCTAKDEIPAGRLMMGGNESMKHPTCNFHNTSGNQYKLFASLGQNISDFFFFFVKLWEVQNHLWFFVNLLYVTEPYSSGSCIISFWNTLKILFALMMPQCSPQYLLLETPHHGRSQFPFKKYTVIFHNWGAQRPKSPTFCLIYDASATLSDIPF